MPLLEDEALKGEKFLLFVAIVCRFTFDICCNYFEETTNGSLESRLLGEFSD